MFATKIALDHMDSKYLRMHGILPMVGITSSNVCKYYTQWIKIEFM